jgi:hypothetical protein
MSSLIDYWLVYKFVKLISSPFDKWPAFKSGVIDKTGAIIVDKDKRTLQQKDDFTLLDLLVRNIKVTLEKIPGGKSSIARYAAALYLIREHNMFTTGNVLTESVEDIVISQEILEKYINEETLTTVGVPGFDGNTVSKSAQRRYTKRNKEDSDDTVEDPIHSDDTSRKKRG